MNPFSIDIVKVMRSITSFTPESAELLPRSDVRSELSRLRSSSLIYSESESERVRESE